MYIANVNRLLSILLMITSFWDSRADSVDVHFPKPCWQSVIKEKRFEYADSLPMKDFLEAFRKIGIYIAFKFPNKLISPPLNIKTTLAIRFRPKTSKY